MQIHIKLFIYNSAVSVRNDISTCLFLACSGLRMQVDRLYRDIRYDDQSSGPVICIDRQIWYQTVSSYDRIGNIYSGYYGFCRCYFIV